MPGRKTRRRKEGTCTTRALAFSRSNKMPTQGSGMREQHINMARRARHLAQQGTRHHLNISTRDGRGSGMPFCAAPS